jgi:urease accessory protein
MSAVMAGPLLSLLHLCDSLFPIGAFAHSDGLEAATAAGLVGTGDDLQLWLGACLDETLGRCEGPAVLLAWRAAAEGNEPELRELDAELNALRPSSTARRASRGMGARLLRTWRRIGPDPLLAWLGEEPPLTLPVAFGVACWSAGIAADESVLGFLYTRLAASIAAAMRLIAIGQLEAHAVLAASLRRAPAVAATILARGDRPSAFCPAIDLALMSHQYVYSRLFRS